MYIHGQHNGGSCPLGVFTENMYSALSGVRDDTYIYIFFIIYAYIYI